MIILFKIEIGRQLITGGNGRQREATNHGGQRVRVTIFGLGDPDTDVETIYWTLSDKLFREQHTRLASY